MNDITREALLREPRIIFGRGAAERFTAAIGEIAPEGAKVLFISDGGAASERIGRMLSAKYRLQRAPEGLTAERGYALGIRADEDVMAVASAGGEEATDVGKFLASGFGKKHVAAALSCAMGKALLPSATLLVRGGAPETYKAEPPAKVIVDPELMSTSDAELAAGFGEVCSRLAALFDGEVRALMGGPTYDAAAGARVKALTASLLAAAERGEADSETVARHSAALAALAGLPRSAAYGGGDERAQTAFELYRRKRGGELRRRGESALTFAAATMRAYIAFLLNPVSAVRVPDNNLRLSALACALGLNPCRAAETVGEIVPAPELDEKLYVLGEYRSELLKTAFTYEKALIFAAAKQKRLYKDAGYAYNKYLGAAELGLSLALAPEMPGRPTLLTLIKQTGLLDGPLRNVAAVG